MWEFPQRITSHASGAFTNRSLKARVPWRRYQHPCGFQLTGAPFVTAGAAIEGARSSAEAWLAESDLLVEGRERQVRYPFDPNATIAAAFKAAGLPVPEIPAAQPGPTPRVLPDPIIVAALKAARLVRS
jgi:hypothetical protein